MSFIRAEGLYPDACVVTKGIKADCNHLMRTTYPDARVGVVDLQIIGQAIRHPLLKYSR